MAEPTRSFELKNGLLLRFYDLSNRYFGDFHRICLKVVGEIPLARLSLPTDLLPAAAPLPETIGFEKYLTRMGVASASCDRVRAALIDDFIRTTVPYLESAVFPEHLLRKQLAEKMKRFSSPPAGD